MRDHTLRSVPLLPDLIKQRDGTRRVAGVVIVVEAIDRELARQELEKTPNALRRRQLLKLLEGLTVHRVSADMSTLAEDYVRAGVFTRIMVSDAVHVAAAVLTRQDILLSWNFRHLVNRVQEN